MNKVLIIILFCGLPFFLNAQFPDYKVGWKLIDVGFGLPNTHRIMRSSNREINAKDVYAISCVFYFEYRLFKWENSQMNINGNVEFFRLLRSFLPLKKEEESLSNSLGVNYIQGIGIHSRKEQRHLLDFGLNLSRHHEEDYLYLYPNIGYRYKLTSGDGDYNIGGFASYPFIGLNYSFHIVINNSNQPIFHYLGLSLGFCFI